VADALPLQSLVQLTEAQLITKVIPYLKLAVA